LLSTLSLENAVTFGYEAVTDSSIGTYTLQFNRLHRRTSYRRQSVVYVVENKCFPPSGDGSYGKDLFLAEEGHYLGK
jgi:hypothetical protein